jgi:hypothetical protein
MVLAFWDGYSRVVLRGEEKGSPAVHTGQDSHSQQLVNKTLRDFWRDSKFTVSQRAPVIQNSLCLVERKEIRSLEEFSDGDLVAPEDGSFHCLVPIGRIIRRIILKFFDALPEPGVRVVVVVSDAGAEDIDK